MMRFPLFGHRGPVFAPEDGAGAGTAAADTGAAADAPPGGAAAAGDPPAAKPWFEGEAFDPDTQGWLKAKGFAVADPSAALANITKAARNAEKLVGKGPETVLDRPAKDQPLAEWRKANAEALGLPKDEAGYAAAAPEDWPKDIPWNSDLEAKARAFAATQGVDLDTHKGYVGLFAEFQKGLHAEAAVALAQANTAMMADLQRSYGDKMPQALAQARQAAQYFGAQAGLDSDGLAHITKVLSDGVGDAAAIKFMAAIGQAMGEDAIAGAGSGTGNMMGMTASQAAQELARFQSPDGEYGKAFAAGDRRKLAELAPRREALSRLAVLGQAG